MNKGNEGNKLELDELVYFTFEQGRKVTLSQYVCYVSPTTLVRIEYLQKRKKSLYIQL